MSKPSKLLVALKNAKKHNMFPLKIGFPKIMRKLAFLSIYTFFSQAALLRAVKINFRCCNYLGGGNV